MFRIYNMFPGATIRVVIVNGSRLSAARMIVHTKLSIAPDRSLFKKAAKTWSAKRNVVELDCCVFWYSLLCTVLNSIHF